MEASRESGQGAGVRARTYGVVAAASGSRSDVDGPASAVPMLTEQLRERMEDVRGQLRTLAEAAARPETDGARVAWPPPDPRDAVPAPPSGPTVTVGADLLQRIRDDLVATRALLVRASTFVAWSVSGAGGGAPEPPRDRAAVSAGPAPVSSDREKACMIALNMALNGASRGETDRYLAEHFDLVDARGIVADAYAHWARIRANPHSEDA